MNTEEPYGIRALLRSAAAVFLPLMALLSVAGCGGDGDADASAATPVDSTHPSSLATNRVVFVGASITDGWDFGAYFPCRDFRKVLHYGPDKTEVWDEIAAHNAQYVVVKECAAYFNTGGGTPLADYQNVITGMVALVRGVGAIPVLATTIPVDVGAGDCTQAQLQDINAFNAWLRAYCASQGIVCMDLNAAVADSNGQLPASFHDGDGLHPNETGYNSLTTVVLPALRAAGYTE